MLAKHRPLHPTSIFKDGAEYTQASAAPAILSFLVLPWKPGRATVAGAPGGEPGVHISVNPAQMKLHFSP